MTAKHFKILALIVQRVRPEKGNDLKDWYKLINTAADVCAGENVRFNRNKFVKACLKEEQGENATQV